MVHEPNNPQVEEKYHPANPGVTLYWDNLQQGVRVLDNQNIFGVLCGFGKQVSGMLGKMCYMPVQYHSS